MQKSGYDGSQLAAGGGGGAGGSVLAGGGGATVAGAGAVAVQAGSRVLVALGCGGRVNVAVGGAGVADGCGVLLGGIGLGVADGGASVALGSGVSLGACVAVRVAVAGLSVGVADICSSPAGWSWPGRWVASGARVGVASPVQAASVTARTRIALSAAICLFSKEPPRFVERRARF